MGFFSCVNKTFLFILNFVVFAVGVSVITLASFVIHKGRQLDALFSDGIVTLPIYVLAVGILITILGFFGCCGALKESSCMLYTYGTVVLVLLVAEITLGVLVAIYPTEAEDHVKTGLNKMFEKYNKSHDAALDATIDAWQFDYKCCGIEGPNDWFNFPYGQIPRSCCVNQANCENFLSFITGRFHSKGCFDAIIDDMQAITIALGIAAIILAIVQVACICVSCGLANRASEYAH